MAVTNDTRRYGDRKEGRLLRTLEPAYRVLPYTSVGRAEYIHYHAESVDAVLLRKYLAQRHQQGQKDMTILHLLIAAYVRAVAHCPGLNRFVAGQKIYARQQIDVILDIHRALTPESPKTTVKVSLEPTDTLFDVYHKVNEYLDENRASARGNPAERWAESLVRLPGLLLKPVMWAMRTLYYFDRLPRTFIQDSPFHGSVRITDFTAIGAPPLYHGLSNFGSLPVSICLGGERTITPTVARIDYRVAMDGRCADDLYLAAGMKYLAYYLQHPEELEKPPTDVRQDFI